MSLLLKFNTFLIVNVFNAKECNAEVLIYKKSLIESDMHNIFVDIVDIYLNCKNILVNKTATQGKKTTMMVKQQTDLKCKYFGGCLVKKY